MQTASSAITGFTATASNGKPSPRNESQREDAGGFATSLRSAMPEDGTSLKQGQARVETGQPKGNGAGDATDTTDTSEGAENTEATKATEDRDARESKRIRRKRNQHNEQTLARALKANPKSLSGSAASVLTQSLAVDADGSKVINEKKSAISRELPENRPAELSDQTLTQAEHALKADEAVTGQERPATDVDVDAELAPKRPVQESLESPPQTQHRDHHASALTGTDTESGDRRRSQASPIQDSTNPDSYSDTSPNPDAEATASVPLRESTTGPADTRSSTPQEAATRTAATDKPKASNKRAVADSAQSPVSQTGSIATPDVNSAATSESGQPVTAGSTPNTAASGKAARAEPQTSTIGQATPAQISGKTKAPVPATPQQDKSLEAALASGPAGQSTRSPSNAPVKARGTSHHKSSSSMKTHYGAGEPPGTKAKLDLVATAKAEALASKQAATGIASPGEVGVDRVGLAAAHSASKSPVASSDLAPTLTQLPDIDAPLDPANVSEAFQGQLGERLVMAVRNDMSRAEIRINPNELGPITIELLIDGNTTAVSFGAENNSTRTALQDSLPSLRDQLAREGLTLGETSVGEQSHRSSDENDREQEAEQWSELHSDSSDLSEEHTLPDGYRTGLPARGLVDLFA